MNASAIAAQRVATFTETRKQIETDRNPATAQRSSTEFEKLEPEVAPVDEEIIESALERSGRQVVFGGRTIEFNYDSDIGRVIVKVRAEDSGEIVRQIPPEEYLKLVAQFNELAGVLFNETV